MSRVSGIDLETGKYVPVTRLVPRRMVLQGFWGVVSASAPSSHGDVARMVVPAYALAGLVESCRDQLAYQDINRRRTGRLVKKLMDLDETLVDMEN